MYLTIIDVHVDVIHLLHSMCKIVFLNMFYITSLYFCIYICIFHIYLTIIDLHVDVIHLLHSMCKIVFLNMFYITSLYFCIYMYFSYVILCICICLIVSNYLLYWPFKSNNFVTLMLGST